MKKIFIISYFLFSFAWSIGLQGLLIPENGLILSTAGTGIASDIDPKLNPAMSPTPKSYIQYSINSWLGDINGGNTLFRWGGKSSKQVSIQTWSAKEIELWGDSPNDRPLGTFGVHLATASFSISHHLNTPFRFGMQIQSIYSHLFTESVSGITLSAGAIFPFNSSIKLGGVIRNIGYEFNNQIRSEIPIEVGFGISYKIPFINSTLLIDQLYNSINGEGTHLAIRTNWKWINFNSGISKSDNRNASSVGLSIAIHRLVVNCGIYFHENAAVLGTPLFIDIRHYL